MAERRLTTQQGCLSSAHTHTRVLVCTHEPECSGGLPFSTPTCVLLRVLSQRALLRAAEVLPEAVGAHPRFCVSATKERMGAFREERRGKEGGGRGVGVGGGAVRLGMSRPCGWLSTHSDTQP